MTVRLLTRDEARQIAARNKKTNDGKLSHQHAVANQDDHRTVREYPSGIWPSHYLAHTEPDFTRLGSSIWPPGAFLGVHHHVGPGVRYVLSGELTFTEGGKSTIYHA